MESALLYRPLLETLAWPYLHLHCCQRPHHHSAEHHQTCPFHQGIVPSESGPHLPACISHVAHDGADHDNQPKLKENNNYLSLQTLEWYQKNSNIIFNFSGVIYRNLFAFLTDLNPLCLVLESFIKISALLECVSPLFHILIWQVRSRGNNTFSL